MSSNNPAHPDNNRHHTDGYRSYEDWASQFDLEPDTGEPSMWEPGELEASNAALRANFCAPIDWDKGMEPFLDDDGNLGGIENQQPSKNAATAATTCGYRV